MASLYFFSFASALPSLYRASAPLEDLNDSSACLKLPFLYSALPLRNGSLLRALALSYCFCKSALAALCSEFSNKDSHLLSDILVCLLVVLVCASFSAAIKGSPGLRLTTIVADNRTLNNQPLRKASAANGNKSKIR